MPGRTNEITCFAAFLAPYDNQPELHLRLWSLPWKDVTARRYDREIGHGRRKTRATRALTITDLGLDFPHAVQAARILRHRQLPDHLRDHRPDLTGSLTRAARPARSGPSRTGSTSSAAPPLPRTLPQLPARGTPTKIRTGHGPENMATLRNLAINTLRTAGHRNIAAGLRHASYEPFTRPLDLLGIVRPEHSQDHRTLQHPWATAAPGRDSEKFTPQGCCGGRGSSSGPRGRGRTCGRAPRRRG
ncbi:hypothetical protein KNE206_61700 [Kitasatospora sp. NE20-6]